MGDVSDPALRRAGLDGRQAEEADLQPRGGELRQLEAQTDRTDLQHGGRAEAGHLQLKETQDDYTNSVTSEDFVLYPGFKLIFKIL